MSVSPSTRQRKIGMQLYAAYKSGKEVYVNTFASVLSGKVIDVKQSLGTVYYNVGKGWTGMQHVESIEIK